MILQPLVENAIRHGIAASREQGWIELATTNGDGKFHVRVSNSTGLSVVKSNSNGVGLRNVEARLRFLYSGDADLRLTFGQDRTAAVILSLPALQSPPAIVQASRINLSSREGTSHARSHRR